MISSIDHRQIARLGAFRDRLTELLGVEREEDIAGLAGVLIGIGAALLITRGYSKEQLHLVLEKAAEQTAEPHDPVN